VETLQELWRIVEMRNGCVFRTEYVEDVWVPLGEKKAPDGFQYSPLSSSREQEMINNGLPTIRRKK
jgi:hypothetical protein